jgi:hypothetical protein
MYLQNAPCNDEDFITFLLISTKTANVTGDFHFFVLFFIRAIFKLYIYIPTNCTQLIYFINNTLKHMYCPKN